MRLLSTSFDPDRFAFDLVEVSPSYDVSDVNSYNGGITSGLANRLIVELLAGLSLTKKGMTEGRPVRPKHYRGKGHTYHFGKAPKRKIPKRPPLNYGSKARSLQDK
jgi:agmatinase